MKKCKTQSTTLPVPKSFSKKEIKDLIAKIDKLAKEQDAIYNEFITKHDLEKHTDINSWLFCLVFNEKKLSDYYIEKLKKLNFIVE